MLNLRAHCAHSYTTLNELSDVRVFAHLSENYKFNRENRDQEFGNFVIYRVLTLPSLH